MCVCVLRRSKAVNTSDQRDKCFDYGEQSQEATPPPNYLKEEKVLKEFYEISQLSVI